MSNNSLDLLAAGFLQQFSSLKDLEDKLEQLLNKQNEMLDKDIRELNIYHSDEQIAEVLGLMQQINCYRLKVKNLRSEMLYIHQRVTELKRKSLQIQTMKVDEKAEKVKRLHYETELIKHRNKN